MEKQMMENGFIPFEEYEKKRKSLINLTKEENSALFTLLIQKIYTMLNNEGLTIFESEQVVKQTHKHMKDFIKFAEKGLKK